MRKQVVRHYFIQEDDMKWRFTVCVNTGERIAIKRIK